MSAPPLETAQVQLTDADLERLASEEQTTVYTHEHESTRAEWDMTVVSAKFRQLQGAFERHVQAHPAADGAADKAFLAEAFAADPELKRCCADHPRFFATVVDRDTLRDRTRLDVLFAMLTAKTAVQRGEMSEEDAQRVVFGAMLQRHRTQQSD
jgi:Asp-tRNA(Asn)/Glu-tRNA(Gln) amidotransferase A subunit family amidase